MSCTWHNPRGQGLWHKSFPTLLVVSAKEERVMRTSFCVRMLKKVNQRGRMKHSDYGFT